MYTLSSSDLLPLQRVMAGTGSRTGAPANWAWRSAVSLFISFQIQTSCINLWPFLTAKVFRPYSHFNLFIHWDSPVTSPTLCLSVSLFPLYSLCTVLVFMPQITDEKSGAVIARSHRPKGSIPNDCPVASYKRTAYRFNSIQVFFILYIKW